MAAVDVATLNEPLTGPSLPADWQYPPSPSQYTFVTGGVRITGCALDTYPTTYSMPVGSSITLRMWGATPGSPPGSSGGVYFIFSAIPPSGSGIRLYTYNGAIRADGQVSTAAWDPTVDLYIKFERTTTANYTVYSSLDNTTWTARGVLALAGPWQLDISANWDTVNVGNLLGHAAPPATITVTANPAAETDTARPVAYLAPISAAANPAAETDTGQPVVYIASVRATAGPAPETDTASAVTYLAEYRAVLGPATEADAAPAVTYLPPAVLRALAAAAETDTGQPVTYLPPLSAGLGHVTTHDTAQPMTYAGPPPIGIDLGAAVEWEAAVHVRAPAATLTDTLLVDGIDLQTLPGVVVADLAGLFAPGTRRGSDDTIPGRRGQVGAQLPLDAYAFTIPVTLGGPGRGRMVANLRALAAALAGTNGLVTLTRRLSDDDSDAGYVEHTAAGRYVGGTAIDMLNPDTGRTELQFINLDGAWFDGETWLVP